MSAYYIVLDLEMNPISPENTSTAHGLRAEIIEIGAVKVSSATNQITDEFTCLVCPQFNHRIEPNITRLTGITTREVRSAGNFESALCEFFNWIGSDPVRIYSWSPADLLQLRNECNAKHIAFPGRLHNWVDFQAEFPKYVGCSKKRCLSLKDAAQMAGTTVFSSCAHRALYDAQITSNLVQFALTGAYKHHSVKTPPARSSMTYSIGDACGGKLAALLARLNDREEREGYLYGSNNSGTTEAFVR